MSKHKETPYFIMHSQKLQENLSKLQTLEQKVGVEILHTLKSFNQASVLPTIAQNLSGMSISSLGELQMAQEAKAKHLHLYAPAFKASELQEMLKHIDTISFNSLNQWNSFKSLKTSKGLRINPKLPLSIPSHCNPNLNRSRLGVDTFEFLEAFSQHKENFNALEGLHFHALFQSSMSEFNLLLAYILDHFNAVLPQLKWLNLGGGHNFTELDYDVDDFCKAIEKFKNLYPHIQLYFEPGEAVTKGCGEFVTTILDIVKIEGEKIVILDSSIETHLLDVAIVKLKLQVRDTQKEPTNYHYQLTGNSCLQGDIIGDYYFKKELQIGDKIIFEDMMPYTMVKMTEFNGIKKAQFYQA